MPDVTRALIERYGRPPAAAKHANVPRLPARRSSMRGMGPLRWIELERFDGKVEFWDFSPMPRLCYDARTSQLWHVGGRYRIDGDGFHNRVCRARKCVNPLSRRDVKSVRRDPDQRAPKAAFLRNHKGVIPREAVSGVIVVPREVVIVGYLKATTYVADKGDGHGRFNYRHSHEEENNGESAEMPYVGVSRDGTRFVVIGGTYRLVEGWLDL